MYISKCGVGQMWRRCGVNVNFRVLIVRHQDNSQQQQQQQQTNKNVDE